MPSSHVRSKPYAKASAHRSAGSHPHRVSSTRAKSVNEIEATPVSQVEIERFLERPSALVDFPSGCSEQEKIYGANAAIALNSITANTTRASFKRFHTTMKCKVCGTAGHSFDDCPIVQNVPFVQKAFIKTSCFLRAMEKDQALLSVDVTAPDSDAYHTAQDVESSDETASDGSGPEDFCQGD